MDDPGSRSLGHDLLVFGAASVGAQLISAATTPIFTRVLGPTEFGVLEAAMAVVSLGMTLFVLGFDQGLVVRITQSGDRGRRGAFLGSSLALPLAITVIASIAALGAASFLDEPAVVVSIAVGMPFLVVSYLSQQGLRALDLVGPFVWSVMFRSLAATVFTCALILLVSPTAAGVLIGTALGAAIAVATNVIALRRRSSLAITRTATNDLLRFGLPLLPSALAGWSSMLVDRLVLAREVSFAEVGVYGVATRIAGLLLTLLYGFQTAWTARAVSDYHRNPTTENQRRADALVLLGGVIGFSGAVLCAFGPELVAVLGGAQYSSATNVLPILVLANGVFALTAVAQIPALAKGRTAVISCIALASAALNLVLNFVLIPWIGMFGAALATLASFCLLSGAQLWVSRSISPAGLPLGRVGVIWIALTPMALLGLLPTSPALFIGKLVTVAVAAAALHRFRLFSYHEARRILLGTNITR